MRESERLMRAALSAWRSEHPEEAEPVSFYVRGRNEFAALAERTWCEGSPGQGDGIDVPMIARGAHVLYEAIDGYENPLYVGITSNYPARMRAHERCSTWWRFCSEIRATICLSRDDALFREATVLFCDPPPFNLAGRK